MDSDSSDDGITPVVYGEIPASPVARVSYTSTLREDSDNSDHEIHSPQKKPRLSRANPIRRSRQVGRATLRVTQEKRRAVDQQEIGDNTEDYESHSQEMEVGDHSAGNTEPDHTNNRSYELFLESLEWDDSMFTQLSEDLFVVHGWNQRTNEATANVYHLSRSRTGVNLSVTCLCPQSLQCGDCVHGSFFETTGTTYFPLDCGLTTDNDRIFLFSRYEDAVEDTYVTRFSVPTPRATFSTLKSRAIVEHNGPDSGDGLWKCSLDQGAINCAHIYLARKSLQEHVQSNINAEDPNSNGQSLRYPADSENHTSSVRRLSTSPKAISYQLLPPPLWARIKSDPLFGVIPFLLEAPELIRLSNTSACPCSKPPRMYSENLPITVIPCVIYTLTGVLHSSIETQQCNSCSIRHIGPDGSDIGLFNWNNRILFTLDLLDDYTSAFTSSETPFVAWVTVVNRRYLNRGSSTFVSDKTFRAVWFAYIKLVSLENDMTCTRCGPTPDVTIFDGVTLAFNRKNLLTTMKPPTIVTPTSEVKENVKSVPNLQCIRDKATRKNLRQIVSGGNIPLPDLAAFSLDDDNNAPTQETRMHVAMAERIQILPVVLESLQDTDTHLAAMFNSHFGELAISTGHVVPAVYRKLLTQIAAEESALQLVNGAAMQKVLAFILSPNKITASDLKLVPALYNVISYEIKKSGTVQASTIGTAKWLYKVSYSALKTLEKYGYPVKATVPLTPYSDAWQETGACYGLPQIRERPSYPSFPNDAGRDKANQEKRGDGCNKFYSKYGETRLTGGIMCVWCTHSVCYGFHCIPSAEGRNDVFSAIYTRWEQAPKMIVYDFACALQPYCMAREPEFFANTLFVIDAFHSGGHTKCGHATFLTTYCESNPELLKVNSSAAECGNGGIKKIRKSVSYMSQDRAVIFTKVFISIWNRIRIQKMEKDCVP